MSDLNLMVESHDALAQELEAYHIAVHQIEMYFDGRPLGPEGVEIMFGIGEILLKLERRLEGRISMHEQLGTPG